MATPTAYQSTQTWEFVCPTARCMTTAHCDPSDPDAWPEIMPWDWDPDTFAECSECGTIIHDDESDDY